MEGGNDNRSSFYKQPLLRFCKILKFSKISTNTFSNQSSFACNFARKSLFLLKWILFVVYLEITWYAFQLEFVRHVFSYC